MHRPPAQCGVPGLHSKKCPPEGFAADGEHGVLQLAKRDCALTELGKPQGGQYFFKLYHLYSSI